MGAIIDDTIDVAAAVFDEMGDAGSCRPQYRLIREWLDRTPMATFHLKRREAEVIFRRTGITFAVYAQGGDPERLIPFDIIPRVIDLEEWAHLARGLEQRVRAINAFLADVYGKQEFVRAGKMAPETIFHNAGFSAEMAQLEVAHGIYVHISGVDVVRTAPEQFYVLEDNCRTPSGVSYMLENREAMMRLFPDVFSSHRVKPISHYPEELLETLRSVAPRNCGGEPSVVLLTPGSYNSAYYEHSFLADEMGIEIVEGADLVVQDLMVYMRTTRGLQRVDVVYRRIDDAFLDPLVFRPDSMIGVPGLMAAYRAGNVTVANAVGTGIADDKAIYTYVPEMIRFFLGEEPILSNVPTWKCALEDERRYVLEHLAELVVKDTQGSGGYGMLVGPHASRAEREQFAAKIRALPDRYIAQPTLALSTCPTFVESGVAPRHVDLRPFVLMGREIKIVPGGLTRVALRDRSLVVNSSQGGGTKDTWVVEHC